MSRYDGRAADSCSYRDRRSDVGYGGGGYELPAAARKEAAGGAHLNGLTPFEKNFYVESPSVAAMSGAEVEAYRRRWEITVEGRDVPKPVKDFRGVGYPDYVMQEIIKAGFVEPTPIQAQGWPMALKGRELVILLELLKRDQEKPLPIYYLPLFMLTPSQY